MERNKKHELVQRLKQDLDGVDTVFLCNFKGLSVAKDTELRRKMREQGARYEVVKNTLLKLAFTDTTFSEMDPHLEGNTAVAHSGEDLVGLAKLIRDFAEDNESFQFKSGVVEGKVIDVNGLEALASMPPKEELVGKMMYMLNYPVQGLVTALNGVYRNLAVVLEQVRLQKEESQ